MSGFDYTLLKKPEAYSDSKGTIVGRPLYPSEAHWNLIALADAIHAMLGPLTQAQFGSRVDAVKMWVPIGFVYIQFPGMSLPSNLMMGTWSNISSNFAGDFFRAEGGNALAFEGGEQPSANLLHTHGNGSTGGMSGNDPHAHSNGMASMSVSSASGSQRATPPPASNTGSTSIAHTHSIASSGENESRPVNKAIRIWQRQS